MSASNTKNEIVCCSQDGWTLFKSDTGAYYLRITSDKRSDYFELDHYDLIKLKAHASTTFIGYVNNSLSCHAYPFNLVLDCTGHKLILKMRKEKVVMCRQIIDGGSNSRFINKYFELTRADFTRFLSEDVPSIGDKISCDDPNKI